MVSDCKLYRITKIQYNQYSTVHDCKLCRKSIQCKHIVEDCELYKRSKNTARVPIPT